MSILYCKIFFSHRKPNFIIIKIITKLFVILCNCAQNESQFFRIWNTIRNLWFDLASILQSLCAEPLYFPNDMIIIFYFNIRIRINITKNPTFSKVFKIFIIFCSHHKLFVKMFLHHISIVFNFFDLTTDKILNSIFI